MSCGERGTVRLDRVIFIVSSTARSRIPVVRFFAELNPYLRSATMGLFASLFGDKGRTLLLDLIAHNADMIEREEERTRNDAEYLAICLILDDLAIRPNGQQGHQTMMKILANEYSAHQTDVMTYLAVTYMKLPLKPDAEKALLERHRTWRKS